MFKVALIVAVASSVALAGPPDVAYTDVTALAVSGGELVIAGADDCIEGGARGFVARRSGGREITVFTGNRLGPIARAMVAARGALIAATPKLLTEDFRAEMQALWGDGDTVVGVGDGGRIVRSTDAGASWTMIESPTAESLRAIAGHGDTLVATGWNGAIIASTDRGATWTSQRYDTNRTVMSVALGSAQDGYAVVDGGTLIATHDGKRWRKVKLPAGDPIASVWSAGRDVVVAGSRVLVSHDAGATWNAATVDVHRLMPGPTDEIYGFTYSGAIVHSTDRGASWESFKLQHAHRCTGG